MFYGFFVLNTYYKFQFIWNISSLHNLRYKHIWLRRCVYTHSLYLWNLLKAFYRLGCPFAQASLPASHPVCPWSAQSANCPRLPRAIQQAKNYFIVIQVSILWGPTQAHIFLLSWHSSRMPHSITFAWSILQLTVEFINNSNKYQ